MSIQEKDTTYDAYMQQRLHAAQSEVRARPDNYSALRAVLAQAVAQAETGKGNARHANGEAFEDQKICALNRFIGSPDGAIFQACKKAIESNRLAKDAAIAELLGAINYLAAAVILRQEQAELIEK